MSTSYRSVALGACGVVVAALAALLFLRGGGDPPLEIATAPVTDGTIARRVMLTGTIQPARAVDLGSQVSGTIRSIEADFNDTVRAGQIRWNEARIRMEVRAPPIRADRDRGRPLRRDMDGARER